MKSSFIAKDSAQKDPNAKALFCAAPSVLLSHSYWNPDLTVGPIHCRLFEALQSSLSVLSETSLQIHAALVETQLCLPMSCFEHVCGHY
jgi:hypothetical protein